jgi:hypothetical protein
MRAVNLIPSDQRSGVAIAGRSGGAAYVVIGLVFGLAVMALLYGLADHEIATKQNEANELTAEAQREQARASRLAPYVTFAAMREERLKAVQQLANTRFDWAHAMHELGRVLPHDASLSNVTATVGSKTGESSTSAATSSSASTAGGSSVASATPAGSTPAFTIAGCATSQSEVALTMNRMRLIDGVSEVSLESSTKGGSSSSSGGGGSGSSCPAGDPVFTIEVTFDALPQPAVSTPSSGSAIPTGTSAGGSASTGASSGASAK